MSFWTAVVVIVAIVAVTILRLRRADFIALRAEQSSSRGMATDSELEREIARLRERVAVLERIATEDRKARAIADEIETLRD